MIIEILTGKINNSFKGSHSTGQPLFDLFSEESISLGLITKDTALNELKTNLIYFSFVGLLMLLISSTR